MTTKTFKVYKGYSNYITIKKPRYWSATDTKILTTDSSYMYTLQQFSGLNATVNGSVVTVNSQDLWSGDYFNSKGSYILKTTGNNYLATDNNFYSGCLESGLSDTENVKTYTSFVKPDGSLMLSESDYDKTGWIWSNIITVPPHTVMDAKKANFTVNGTPTFNNYVASGFSASNYLTGNKTIPHSEFFTLDGIRFITKFKYTDTSTKYAMATFSSPSNGAVSWIGINGNQIALWNSSFVYGGTLTINTEYWLQAVWDNTGCKIYIYDGETPPDDLSQWTLAVTHTSSTLNEIYDILLGKATDGEYFRGDIDLLNTRIDTGVNNITEGVTVWNTFWKALE